MKKSVSRVKILLGTAALSMMIALNVGTVTVKANVPAEAEAADASTLPPGPTDPVDKNGTAQGNGSGDPLTPDGNGTEVDSVDDNGKYFYTFKTDAGNYFYIVVDETRKDKNVYVLSPVREDELLALCGQGTEEGSTTADASADPAGTKNGADLFGTPGGSSSGGSDSNGDGSPDSWDMNGDGITDAWDTNGDGKPDSFDTNGDGVPDICIIGPNVVTYDTNGDGLIDAWDTDGDGIVDTFDSDGDGIPDKFGAEAAQAADIGKKDTGTDIKKSMASVATGNSSNILFILAVLAGLGAGYYFKFYKPKHGPIGSGSSMDFEDDPDYQDEEDDYNDQDDWEKEVMEEPYEDMEEVKEPEVVQEEIAEEEDSNEDLSYEERASPEL